MIARQATTKKNNLYTKVFEPFKKIMAKTVKIEMMLTVTAVITLE